MLSKKISRLQAIAYLIGLTQIISGSLACRRHTSTENYQVSGNVISGAVFGAKQAPLKILCHRLPNMGTSKPYDLVIERQFDGSYTAYVRNSLKAMRDQTIYESVPNLWPYDRWDIAHNYHKMVTFEGGLLSQSYLMTYDPGNDGRHRSSMIWSTYWNAAPTSDLDLIKCEAHNKLAPTPPQTGDRLTVVGTLYNPKTKVLEQVVQSIQVDVLTQHGPAKSEVILSLTNSFVQNRLPINAPVYNQKDELVGYVTSHRPLGVLGVVITSIHDPKLGAQLKDLIEDPTWQPKPPEKRVPSHRFLDLVCSRVAR